MTEQGQIASPSTDTATKTEPKAEAKKSAATAFEDLRMEVGVAVNQISDLWDFASKVKTRLLQNIEHHQLEAMKGPLNALFNIHDVVYTAYKGGAKKSKQTDFVAALLEAVEEEMKRLRIEVIEPMPGDAYDATNMDVVKTVSLAKGQKPNTVEGINRCGFASALPQGQFYLWRRSIVTLHGPDKKTQKKDSKQTSKTGEKK